MTMIGRFWCMYCRVFFLFQANAIQTYRAVLMASGICWGYPRWKNMMMKCQVITYLGVFMLPYANHYNPDLSLDVVSCLRYHLFSKFGILWLLILPACSLFQHCSCLAWRWQLTIKVLLHCVLPGFHHTHTLGQNTVIITICTECQ